MRTSSTGKIRGICRETRRMSYEHRTSLHVTLNEATERKRFFFLFTGNERKLTCYPCMSFSWARVPTATMQLCCCDWTNESTYESCFDHQIMPSCHILRSAPYLCYKYDGRSCFNHQTHTWITEIDDCRSCPHSHKLAVRDDVWFRGTVWSIILLLLFLLSNTRKWTSTSRSWWWSSFWRWSWLGTQSESIQMFNWQELKQNHRSRSPRPSSLVKRWVFGDFEIPIMKLPYIRNSILTIMSLMMMYRPRNTMAIKCLSIHCNEYFHTHTLSLSLSFSLSITTLRWWTFINPADFMTIPSHSG